MTGRAVLPASGQAALAGLVRQSAGALGRVAMSFEVPAPSFEWMVGDSYKAERNPPGIQVSGPDIALGRCLCEVSSGQLTEIALLC